MSNCKIRQTNFLLKYNTLISKKKYRGFKRSHSKISTWFWRRRRFTQAYDFQKPRTNTSTLFWGYKHKHKHVISKRTRIYKSRWFQREHAYTQVGDFKENTHKHKHVIVKRTHVYTQAPDFKVNWTRTNTRVWSWKGQLQSRARAPRCPVTERCPASFQSRPSSPSFTFTQLLIYFNI